MEGPKVGVGAVIIKENTILLGLRKGAHGEGTWGLPGGHLEPGEEIGDCATRETKEECGLDVGFSGIIGITNDIFEDKGVHYVTLFASCNYILGNPVVEEPHKCERWEWFEFENLPKNLFLPFKNLVESISSFEELKKRIVYSSS